MKKFQIQTPDKQIQQNIQHQIDNKTKPQGSLGDLESLALCIATIQQTTKPTLSNPRMLVFAADHGIANEGVSPFPQEVTYQMVLNFLNQGAAINVFTNQHDIGIKIIDAGVGKDFDPTLDIVNAKIDYGTASFLQGPAMTPEQCEQAIEAGAEQVKICHREGCNVIGFGEMGIANTSSSAILMHMFIGLPLDQCVGRGTGLDDKALEKKKEILQKAADNYKGNQDPLSVLRWFGGFEIAMMCGAFLQAAEAGMVILVDGFIATAALLTASQIAPEVKEYCVFCHQSDESGHKHMLEKLDARPVLKLNLRLGEGTGAALAYPIVQSAVKFLNEMASFEDAGVSNVS